MHCVHIGCSKKVDAVRPRDRSWRSCARGMSCGAGLGDANHSAQRGCETMARLDLAESRMVSAAKHHGDDGEKG